MATSCCSTSGEVEATNGRLKKSRGGAIQVIESEPPGDPASLVHRLSQSRHSGNLILNTKQRVAPAHGESFVWIGALGATPHRPW